MNAEWIHSLSRRDQRGLRVFVVLTTNRLFAAFRFKSSLSQRIGTIEYRVRGMFKHHRHHSVDALSVWFV